MTKQVQGIRNNAKQVVLELGNAINAEVLSISTKVRQR